MKLGAPHSCGESRLTCVDCKAQVCPSCMEQCPVGNRCKKCSDRFTSHVVKVPLLVMVKTGLGAGVVGFVFGLFHSALWGGFYMWFILYGIGFLIGKGLHRLASHKLGKKIVATIIGGMLAGALLSPARDVMLGNNPNSAASIEDLDDDLAVVQEALPLADSAVKAKKRFSEFEEAFKTKEPRQTFTALSPFEDGDDIEHLWITVKSLDGQKLSGSLNTQPTKLKNLHVGSDVSIDAKDLEDWLYVRKDGQPVGGFSFAHGTKITKHEVTNTRYANPYNYFNTSGCWLSFLILTAGVISPVLRVRIRN